MKTVYESFKDAKKVARRLESETGKIHEIRSTALGNKLAFEVINRERFAK